MRATRIFIQRNLETGKTEWFFTAREGNYGPFGSKEIAKQALNAFIQRCIENGDDGERRLGKRLSKLSRESNYILSGRR